MKLVLHEESAECVRVEHLAWKMFDLEKQLKVTVASRTTCIRDNATYN